MSIDSSHPWQGHGSRFRGAVVGFPILIFVACWGLYEILIRHTHYLLGAPLTFLLLVVAAGLVSGALERRVAPELREHATREDQLIGEKLKVSEYVVNLTTAMTSLLVLLTLFA